MIAARAGGIGSTLVPVDRQPDGDVLGSDRGVAGDPAERIGGPPIVTAPDVKPAPNATMHDRVADLDAAAR